MSFTDVQNKLRDAKQAVSDHLAEVNALSSSLDNLLLQVTDAPTEKRPAVTLPPQSAPAATGSVTATEAPQTFSGNFSA